jgi:hypothetical protein
VALFQLEGSSNQETVFERVRFREKGCGCSQARLYSSSGVKWITLQKSKRRLEETHKVKPVGCKKSLPMDMCLRQRSFSIRPHHSTPIAAFLPFPFFGVFVPQLQTCPQVFILPYVLTVSQPGAWEDGGSHNEQLLGALHLVLQYDVSKRHGFLTLARAVTANSKCPCESSGRNQKTWRYSSGCDQAGKSVLQFRFQVIASEDNNLVHSIYGHLPDTVSVLSD